MTDDRSRIARLEVRMDAIERAANDTYKALELLRQQITTAHELATLQGERQIALRQDVDEFIKSIADERTERRREIFIGTWQKVMIWVSIGTVLLGQAISVLIATGVIKPGS